MQCHFDSDSSLCSYTEWPYDGVIVPENQEDQVNSAKPSVCLFVSLISNVEST